MDSEVRDPRFECPSLLFIILPESNGPSRVVSPWFYPAASLPGQPEQDLVRRVRNFPGTSHTGAA